MGGIVQCMYACVCVCVCVRERERERKRERKRGGQVSLGLSYVKQY